MGIAAVVYAIAAIFSEGYLHPDEHHQLLEFAGYKLGLTSAEELPWEFGERMRPTLQAYMVIWVYQFFRFFGIENPFAVATFLRFVSAAFSLFSIWYFLRHYKPHIENQKLRNLLVWSSYLLWFTVFNNVRFSSENWAATSFLIGFTILVLKDNKKSYHYVVAGIVLGFSYVFRFHAGFLIAGLFFWQLFVQKERPSGLVGGVFGGVLAAGIGVLMNLVFYGKWSFVAYNYVYQNLVEGKAASFGTEPWWYYLTEGIVVATPLIGLLIIGSLLVLMVKRPKSPFLWVVVPFVLAHMVVSHKEMRFLLPIAPFFPVLVVNALSLLKEPQLNSRLYRWGMGLTATINFVALAYVCLAPANNKIDQFRFVYEKYPEKTAIYAFSDNPYLGTSSQNFYKRENHTAYAINNWNDVHGFHGYKSLLITKSSEVEKLKPFEGKLVYSSLPEWVKKFNFNGWVERTDFWQIYEIDQPQTDVPRP